LTCLAFQCVGWYVAGHGILRHLTFSLTVGIFFAWLVVDADAELPGLPAWFSGFRFVRFVGKIPSAITFMSQMWLVRRRRNEVLCHYT
jgi:hypothetical protein